MFSHDCPLAVKPASTPRRLVQKKKKKTWRDSLPIDVLLSAVSVLVVVQQSSEILEGLTNYPVYASVLISSFGHYYRFCHYPIIGTKMETLLFPPEFFCLHVTCVIKHGNKITGLFSHVI